jgi:hypothetical protein
MIFSNCFNKLSLVEVSDENLKALYLLDLVCFLDVGNVREFEVSSCRQKVLREDNIGFSWS